ncbi:MAG TPA: hypothetical protein VIJ34_01950 [Acidimicrobiales bacterium]
MSEQLAQVPPRSRGSLALVGALAWLALLGFLAFAEDAFAARWHAGSRFPLVILGTAMGAVVIAGWVATSVGVLRQRLSERAGSERSPDVVVDESVAVPADDASIGAIARPNRIEQGDLSRWVDAVNRLLTLELAGDDEGSLPLINIIRAGPFGIELLLDTEVHTIPHGFSSAGSGLVWRLNPTLRLEEVEARVDSSVAPYLPVLVHIGSDNGASFYVAARSGESIGIAGDDVSDTMSRIVANLVTSPWAEARLYRLGEGTFLGAELLPLVSLDSDGGLEAVEVDTPEDSSTGAQPVIVATDRGLAELARGHLGTAVLIGTAVEANRVLYRSGDTVTIEPAGLVVHVDETEELFANAISRLEELASLAGPEEAETVAELDETRLMPPQGEIEVRILREHPDVVGELSGQPTGAAIQFLAYLATHGGKASTARLRDALGAYYRESSRTTATVRAAAGAVRQLIGSDRLPNASANQQYELSDDVTCDWVRFERALKLARGAHSIGEMAQAVSLLTGALDLVGGLPSPDERRFDWMDVEGLSREMAARVVDAAHLLFTIARANESASLAKWALEKGRLASPENEVLEGDGDELDRTPALRLVNGRDPRTSDENDGDESSIGLDRETNSMLSQLATRTTYGEQAQL